MAHVITEKMQCTDSETRDVAKVNYKEIFHIHEVPKSAGKMYGWVSEQVSKVTDQEPEINGPQAKYMASAILSSSEKARRELGFKSRSLLTMMEDSVDWYVEASFIKRPGKA